MKQARYFLAVLAALLVAPVFPGAAGAHVEVAPQNAPAGKPVNLSFEIGHGCDGAATTGLVVRLPAEVSDVRPLPIEGWTADVVAGTLTWAGGPLPDHDVQKYPLRATLSGEKGDQVVFKALQKCEGGAETAWIQPATSSGEPEHPAPAVTLTSSAEGPVDEQAAADEVAGQDASVTGDPTATGGTDEDGSEDEEGGRSLLLIILVGLVIGTIAGLVVRARRSSS